MTTSPKGPRADSGPSETRPSPKVASPDPGIRIEGPAPSDMKAPAPPKKRKPRAPKKKPLARKKPKETVGKARKAAGAPKNARRRKPGSAVASSAGKGGRDAATEGGPSPDAASRERARQHFLNREWSWLRFNERVLEEAEDPGNPLLERLKFLAIVAGNLDEFFMVRVGGLYRQMEAGLETSGVDLRPPAEQLEGIARIVHELEPRTEQALASLQRDLEKERIVLRGYEDLPADERAFLDRYYDEVVYPVITPMIVGPTHPFPTLQNCTLYLVLNLFKQKKKNIKKRYLAFVGLPRVLPRFVEVRRQPGEHCLVPLESLLGSRMAELFAGYQVRSVSAVRVTRDADIFIDEDAAEDFRKAVARMILGRRHGAAVRLEYRQGLDRAILADLQEKLETDPGHHYAQTGLMQRRDLLQVAAAVTDRPDLLYPPLRPLAMPGDWEHDIFAWLRRGPRLLHHPFHAFDPVAELVRQAAVDPQVLAIKQTLYRTSGDSPIIRALTRAAEQGKHVSVVVELRARFDEERNIEWARKLEQSGAHIVYGLQGYKTHCKVLLVVRREETGIRRYLHLGTGNYNDATARLYTDVGLMCADERLGEDASALFNMITGATQPPDWNKVQISPGGIKRRLLHLVEREVARSTKNSRGRILAKMNSLVDSEVIRALYAASSAGVQVDLIVRGICCLRAGVKGLSENIRVVSIVGRFLEHSRVFTFRNGGQPEVYLSSADWMPRNLDHRVELMAPVEDPDHRRYLTAMLELQLADNMKARVLGENGLYQRVKQNKKKKINSQEAIYQLTQEYTVDQEPGPGRERLVPIRSPEEA